MASNPVITGPATLAWGASGTYTLTFTLDPGVPGRNGHLVLRDEDGTVVIDQAVTLEGRPAEAFPTIVLGSSAPVGGYALALEGANASTTLTNLSQGVYSVRNV
jgi:hypothetical protein